MGHSLSSIHAPGSTATSTWSGRASLVRFRLSSHQSSSLLTWRETDLVGVCVELLHASDFRGRTAAIGILMDGRIQLMWQERQNDKIAYLNSRFSLPLNWRIWWRRHGNVDKEFFYARFREQEKYVRIGFTSYSFLKFQSIQGLISYYLVKWWESNLQDKVLATFWYIRHMT